jgi:hypothetical protein
MIETPLRPNPNLANAVRAGLAISFGTDTVNRLQAVVMQIIGTIPFPQRAACIPLDHGAFVSFPCSHLVNVRAVEA